MLLILLAAFAACGTDSPVTADTTGSLPSTTAPMTETTVPTETEYPGPDVENTDYTGKTIRIQAIEPNDSFPYSEVYYSEETGDIINDSLFRRNAQITAKYGITIETIDSTTGNGLKTLTNSINANNNDIHATSIKIRDVMSAAASGYLANISELPYLDPDAPWYYQKIRESLSIGNEEYVLRCIFRTRSSIPRTSRRPCSFASRPMSRVPKYSSCSSIRSASRCRGHST